MATFVTPYSEVFPFNGRAPFANIAMRRSEYDQDNDGKVDFAKQADSITGGGTASFIQAGSADIGSGVSTISVTFPTAFSAVPIVVISISRPSGEDLIYATIDSASISTTGFTCSLSATTPTANFDLKWMANPAS